MARVSAQERGLRRQRRPYFVEDEAVNVVFTRLTLSFSRRCLFLTLLVLMLSLIEEIVNVGVRTHYIVDTSARLIARPSVAQNSSGV